MSMTSREQFEQAIKARFGDSIDYRVCKNSDGEYMAWDMQVAWWAWQAASKASEQQLAAVVAENGQMLRLLTDISENHDEYVNADEYLYAGVPMDYVSEINMYVSRDVNAENPFKATDAYLAEVRAQGVEAYADNLDSSADDAERNGFDDAVKFLRSEASGVRLFAAQLRQGAEQ